MSKDQTLSRYGLTIVVDSLALYYHPGCGRMRLQTLVPSGFPDYNTNSHSNSDLDLYCLGVDPCTYWFYKRCGIIHVSKVFQLHELGCKHPPGGENKKKQIYQGV